MMGSSASVLASAKHLEEHKGEITSTPEEMEAEEKATGTLSIEPDIEMKEGSSKIHPLFVWFLEQTYFLRGSEIARLFCLNKAVSQIDQEAFWRIQATRTYPLNDVGKAVKGDRTWKQYYQHYFELFGQDGELNFVQIIGIAKDIRAWMKENAPRIHETLNDGADITELSKFLKDRGCQNRAHLAFWTEIDGQDSLGNRRTCEHGFFGGFKFYSSKGNMHLLPVKMILESNNTFRQIRNYDKMCHCIGYGDGRNWHTVQLFVVIMKDGSMRKIRAGSASVSYPQGGGDFLGFIKWYRNALYRNNFRIERCGAINRMPRNDKYGSETITDGLRIRVRTLYVPEMDNGPQVTITYEFEIDCAPGQSPPEGILKSRHFKIGEDDDTQFVNGPGVIGLFPKIGPGMEVFRYNSCTRFSRNSSDCWMEGSFLFSLNSGREFRANINRFYFKWRESPIV